LVGTTYLVVAGPPGDDGSFALFRWTGDKQADLDPLSIFLPEDLKPEALFEIQGAGKVQLLSDDGDVEIDGVKCKKQNDAEKKFRSIVHDIPNVEAATQLPTTAEDCVAVKGMWTTADKCEGIAH